MRPGILLGAAAVLLAAATAGVALSGPAPAHAPFQELTGGLGLGAAVTPGRCACAYDPRLSGTCSLRHDPVPGGSLFCPVHAR